MAASSSIDKNFFMFFLLYAKIFCSYHQRQALRHRPSPRHHCLRIQKQIFIKIIPHPFLIVYLRGKVYNLHQIWFAIGFFACYVTIIIGSFSTKPFSGPHHPWKKTPFLPHPPFRTRIDLIFHARKKVVIFVKKISLKACQTLDNVFAFCYTMYCSPVTNPIISVCGRIRCIRREKPWRRNIRS